MSNVELYLTHEVEIVVVVELSYWNVIGLTQRDAVAVKAIVNQMVERNYLLEKRQ